jgi:glycosyltransferase involved in cell wall biosynthesis
VSGGLSGKRIVLVVAWAGMGGAERQALQLVRLLKEERGAHVEVLAFTDERGRFRDAVERLGVTWRSSPLNWSGSRPAKLRELLLLAARLRRLAPDALLPYTTRPNVLCGLVWRVTGASACIWSQHDLVLPVKFGRGLLTRAARRATLLVASSSTAADFLVSELDAPRERVHVVPNSVELEQPAAGREEWRARLGLAESTVVATMLGNFHRGKDHRTLLRAWRIVLDRMPGDAVLLLAGRAAGTEDATKALAFDLDLGSAVRFLGEIEDVSGLLAASDVAVLSSRSESFPNALIESLAAGLPVAATDAPGIREVLGENQLAFLSAPGNADELAAKLVELISSGSLRRRLGDENRRLAARRSSVPGASVIADLLEEALGTAGTPLYASARP